MKSIKLYPPGGGDPITPHPSDVDYLKSIGWTESEVKPVKKPKESEE